MRQLKPLAMPAAVVLALVALLLAVGRRWPRRSRPPRPSRWPPPRALPRLLASSAPVAPAPCVRSWWATSWRSRAGSMPGATGTTSRWSGPSWWSPRPTRHPAARPARRAGQPLAGRAACPRRVVAGRPGRLRSRLRPQPDRRPPSRLGLQDSRASIAVVGLFDAVAPHRITAGVVGGETLCEIEAPRRSPSARRDQARVRPSGGRRPARAPRAGPRRRWRWSSVSTARARRCSGRPASASTARPFTVYKMRTMVSDADELKHRLPEANEHDGVLFKMKRDPRVTRVGALPPQVVPRRAAPAAQRPAGEMSLVGPRPFLPVGGRRRWTRTPCAASRSSPASPACGRSVGAPTSAGTSRSALDTYYADNWSLGGDAEIALRTVKRRPERQGRLLTTGHAAQ